MDSTNVPVHSDPGILGGTPVFTGTRVPLQSLFDYLEDQGPSDSGIGRSSGVARDACAFFLTRICPSSLLVDLGSGEFRRVGV
jgi:hypothetical protein